jgi:NitT/TauT family transport system ATP-binding protein
MNAPLPSAPLDAHTTQRAADRPPAVEVLSAEKIFANGTRALAPIDLTIAEGEFLTLIGPSGCGKSTLLKLIANLIQPSDGRILWWRGDFGQVGQDGRGLAFVFQEPTLMPWARVDTNVRLPLDLADVPRGKADPRVSDAIARVGLSAFARHYPRQLSGGMKMRVSIARALATEPNLLLMDEPFAALDEITRFKLNNDLLHLWERFGWTVIFVTHSVFESVYLAQRIVVMTPRPGRIFDEIVIDAPYPRDESFRTSAEYAALCRKVSQALAAAVAKGGA